MVKRERERAENDVKDNNNHNNYRHGLLRDTVGQPVPILNNVRVLLCTCASAAGHLRPRGKLLRTRFRTATTCIFIISRVSFPVPFFSHAGPGDRSRA